MPASFMRRRDLFVDAGVHNPDAALASLQGDVKLLGLGGEPRAPVGDAIEGAYERALRLLPDAVRPLVERAPEWMFERGGDLASFLWLCDALAGGALEHHGALLAAAAAAVWRSGRQRDAVGLLRFLFDLDLDWGALYREPGLAYGFFTPREPNPFVWKILEFAGERAREVRGAPTELHVLELGCGIGNDALGWIHSPRVRGYVGVDLSEVALQRHRERVAQRLAERPELFHCLLQSDFVRLLERVANAPVRSDWAERVNVVYSYSSLHYFASVDLRHILELVRQLLTPTHGYFALAIKGKGSVWDGRGVPLYRPDVWIFHDGQSRWFPSRQAVHRMMDRAGFEVLVHELYEHWSYSEVGRRDIFHYVVATPRPTTA